MKLYAPSIVLCLWAISIAVGAGTSVIWAVLLIVSMVFHIQAEWFDREE